VGEILLEMGGEMHFSPRRNEEREDGKCNEELGAMPRSAGEGRGLTRMYRMDRIIRPSISSCISSLPNSVLMRAIGGKAFFTAKKGRARRSEMQSNIWRVAKKFGRDGQDIQDEETVGQWGMRFSLNKARARKRECCLRRLW
jgi:hypothetical protein